MERTIRHPHVREVTGITPKIYVGAVGTFFGGLPGEPEVQATGEIIKILEGPNYAVFSVKLADGSVRLLKL